MLMVESANPDPLLRPFLHCYVQRDLFGGEVKFVEPVFPRAGAMLEFQFASIYKVQAYGTDLLRPSWATTVIGPIDAHRVRLVLGGRVQSLVVMFKPMGLFRLFGVPVSLLKGVGAEGHAVLGQQISFLYERLGNTALFAERVKVLDHFLLNLLNRSAPLPPAAAALHVMAAGRSRVEDAANRAGIGERQLERRALELVGLSPKALARISRFQHALLLKRERRMTWIDVAHQVGYYDQMHMVRDFHNLAGGSPNDVLKLIGAEHLIAFTSSTR